MIVFEKSTPRSLGASRSPCHSVLTSPRHLHRDSAQDTLLVCESHPFSRIPRRIPQSGSPYEQIHGSIGPSSVRLPAIEPDAENHGSGCSSRLYPDGAERTPSSGVRQSHRARVRPHRSQRPFASRFGLTKWSDTSLLWPIAAS